MKIKFPKGINTVHIPFMVDTGIYNMLQKEIVKVKYPKSTRRIEASVIVSIDLKKGLTSYQLAQVSIIK